MIKSIAEVVLVNIIAKTITVKNYSGNETYNVEARVIVNKAGQSVTFAELIAGNKVTLYYNIIADKKVVYSIYIS